MDKITLYLGPPGTGKTTTLLNIMEEEMAAGVPPNRIGFVSFTTKAAYEAADRAISRFGFTRDDLPFFRTIHSIAFRELALSKNDVMSKAHYDELAQSLGVSFTGKANVEEGLAKGSGDGDELLFIDSLARTRMTSVENQYSEIAPDLSLMQQKQFSDTLRAYKEDTGLLDYTDMLSIYHEQGSSLPVDVMIVDEAQDLTPLQWACVWQMVKQVKRLYIAGDDDQAIYRWSGADVETFLELPGDRIVLGKSHRLPKSIHSLAGRITDQISQRYAKEWSPRDDEGLVRYHNQLESIDFGDGDWLLLARNHYQLSKFVDLARDRGIAYTHSGYSSLTKSHVEAVYTWEGLRAGRSYPIEAIKPVYDLMRVGHGVKRGFKSLGKAEPGEYSIERLEAEQGLLSRAAWHDVLLSIPPDRRWYYRNVLRRERSLRIEPKVHINTIHGVKGGEADNVVLMTDMSRKCYDDFERDPDDEHRVFYVGATRAKQALHILEPQSWRGYRMPHK